MAIVLDLVVVKVNARVHAIATNGRLTLRQLSLHSTVSELRGSKAY